MFICRKAQCFLFSPHPLHFAEAQLLRVIDDACAVDVVKAALVADGAKEVVTVLLVENVECNA